MGSAIDDVGGLTGQLTIMMTKMGSLKIRQTSISSVRKLLESDDTITIRIEDGKDLGDDLGRLGRVSFGRASMRSDR